MTTIVPVWRHRYIGRFRASVAGIDTLSTNLLFGVFDICHPHLDALLAKDTVDPTTRAVASRSLRPWKNCEVSPYRDKARSSSVPPFGELSYTPRSQPWRQPKERKELWRQKK